MERVLQLTPVRFLQGWRLFADAHNVQAGDQVAFELVSKNRLVAQIIKRAEGVQFRKVSKATGIKRKAATGPHAPCSVFKNSASPAVVLLTNASVWAHSDEVLFFFATLYSAYP
jgi:hypothetical protein